MEVTVTASDVVLDAVEILKADHSLDDLLRIDFITPEDNVLLLKEIVMKLYRRVIVLESALKHTDTGGRLL